MLNRTLTFIPLILALCCSAAKSQDFFGSGLTAATAAHAGAYTPSASNVSDALTLNPAGLSAINGPTFNLGLNGSLATGSFRNSANSGSPMRFDGGIIPVVAVGTPIGRSRWTIGAGFSPDLLSSSNWQFNDAPGVGGATYGAQREQSRILAFRSSAGVAYRFSPGFQLASAWEPSTTRTRSSCPMSSKATPYWPA